MPISKKQVSTIIDKQHHEHYKAICSELSSMADIRRAAHNLYLDTYDLRNRVLKKYLLQKQSVSFKSRVYLQITIEGILREGAYYNKFRQRL